MLHAAAGEGIKEMSKTNTQKIKWKHFFMQYANMSDTACSASTSQEIFYNAIFGLYSRPQVPVDASYIFLNFL